MNQRAIRLSPGFLVLASVLVATIGCGSHASPATDTASASAPSRASGGADTLRGIVVVSRADGFDQVMLRTASDTVALTGRQAPAIARAAGADVWVEGTRDGLLRVQVNRFAVRAVHGQPAMDGVLVANGERLYLLAPDGARHEIGRAPSGLRQHLGQRVWVTTGRRSSPAAFGVLQGAR
jgi:hypothetical protein